MTKKKFQAIGALTLAAAIWGSSISITKLTLEYTPPFTFLFLRMALAGILVLPFFLRKVMERKYRLEDLKSMLIISLFGQTLHLSFFYLGVERTTALETIILTAFFPVLTVFGGVFFLKEKLTPKEIIGISIIMVGVVSTLVPSIMELFRGESLHFLGNAILLLAGICWTGFVLTSKNLLERYSPTDITLIGIYFGALTFAPLMIWEQFGTPTEFILSGAFPGILYMGIGSSIIAYSLYESGLTRMGASNADLFEYLVPVFAFVPAYLIFREPLTLSFLIGALLLVTGVVICSQGVSGRRMKHPRI